MSLINPKNEREAQRERARMERIWTSIERSLGTRLAREIARYGRDVARVIAGQEGSEGLAAATATHAKHVAALLNKAYRVSATETVKIVANDAGKHLRVALIRKDFDGQFAMWLDSIIRGEALAKSVTIADTSKRLVAGIVADGIAEGLTQREIAEQVGSWAKTSNMRSRGSMIARTEVHGSSQAASLFTVEHSDFGETMNKRWVASRDSRTRSSHEHLSGTIVPMDGLFQVRKGPKLRYPGDSRGDPSEVINCRCVLTYTSARPN